MGLRDRFRGLRAQGCSDCGLITYPGPQSQAQVLRLGSRGLTRPFQKPESPWAGTGEHKRDVTSTVPRGGVPGACRHAPSPGSLLPSARHRGWCQARNPRGGCGSASGLPLFLEPGEPVPTAGDLQFPLCLFLISAPKRVTLPAGLLPLDSAPCSRTFSASPTETTLPCAVGWYAAPSLHPAPRHLTPARVPC